MTTKNKLVFNVRTEVTNPPIDYQEIGQILQTVYLYNDSQRKILSNGDSVIVHITGTTDILTTVVRGAKTSEAILARNTNTLAASVVAQGSNNRVLIVIAYPSYTELKQLVKVIKPKETQEEPSNQLASFNYDITQIDTNFSYSKIAPESTDSIPPPTGPLVNAYSNIFAQTLTALDIYSYLKTVEHCSPNITLKEAVNCNPLLKMSSNKME